jgi:hypothetical protein
VWSHPDLLPTSADLDDPDGFVHGRDDEAEDGLEFDFSGLDELLGGGTADKTDGEAGGKADGPVDNGPVDNPKNDDGKDSGDSGKDKPKE